MEIDRMINESRDKELENKIAEKEYVTALGAPTSQDHRNNLRQECKIFANKLAKIDAAIIKALFGRSSKKFQLRKNTSQNAKTRLSATLK